MGIEESLYALRESRVKVQESSDLQIIWMKHKCTKIGFLGAGNSGTAKKTSRASAYLASSEGCLGELFNEGELYNQNFRNRQRFRSNLISRTG